MAASSEEHDVLVVGAGPAGSTCAGRLHQHGLSVGMIDKARFPRDKVCAGWITPQVLEELDITSEEYAVGRTLQPVTGFRVGLVGRPGVSVHYSHVVSYGIRRCEFDEYLLRRVDVRLREGEPVTSIVREGSGWVVNGRIRCRLLIGAGGHFCPVAQWLRQHPVQPDGPVATAPLIMAQEIEYELADDEQRYCSIEREIPELFFYPDLQGYAWCFRKSHFLNIGLGRIDDRKLQTSRSEFLRWLVETGRIHRAPRCRFHGHAYRLNAGPPGTRVANGVLLLGDAAGLAGAHSGEGIRPAIESALIAADAIVEAHGDYCARTLQGYADRIDGRMKPARLSGRIGTLMRRQLSRTLMSSCWFVRRYVLDEWFLNQSLSALRCRRLPAEAKQDA